MKFKQSLYVAIMPLRRLYWKIFKPKTFGVKVLIKHSENKNEILLVRHTYGDKTLWNIPGGGFNPKKETAQKAALREVMEEIGVVLTDIKQVGEYKTNGEGKQDTVFLFVGLVTGDGFVFSAEISEVVWQDHKIAINRTDVARVARRAIEASFFK